LFEIPSIIGQIKNSNLVKIPKEDIRLTVFMNLWRFGAQTAIEMMNALSK
jgi:hypothetical protein